MPSVFILSGDDVGLSFDFDARIEIGRSKEAQLRLRAPSISRLHACIVPEAGVWILRDLASSNGCFVGAERIDEAVLSDGDVFRLGDLELRFRSEEAPSKTREPEVDTVVAANVTAFFGDEGSAEDKVDSADASQDEDEIALEGDWSDEPASPASPGATARPSPAAAASASNDPAAASVQGAAAQARRRAAAMGAAPSAGQSAAQTGKPVLQYNRVEDRTGLLSADLGQQSGVMRFFLYLGVTALFLGLAYGAYKLTTTMRRQSQDRAPLEDTLDEE